jgi:hypothetical protein
MGHAKYFVPFTPQGAATEHRAIEVKAALHLAPDAAVDPFDVLPRIPARLLDFRVLFGALPLEVRRALFETGVKQWSAIGWGRSPATGEELILLNPFHHPHRQRASLMEEVVHIVVNHPKTTLMITDSGVAAIRSYDQAVEDEAYCVGAACIIPYPALFHAVHRSSETAAVIAGRYKVSRDYVEYRIKRAGLTRVYAKQRRVKSSP